MSLPRITSDARVRSRFSGCLLGGAVGDALGAPVEFLHLDEILRTYGEQGIRDYAPAYGKLGAITDDTQMTLFTAEAVLKPSPTIFPRFPNGGCAPRPKRKNAPSIQAAILSANPDVSTESATPTPEPRPSSALTLECGDWPPLFFHRKPEPHSARCSYFKIRNNSVTRGRRARAPSSRKRAARWR